MRAVFLFFLGIFFAAGVAIFGFGVWVLVDVGSASTSDTPAMAGAAFMGLVGLLAVAIGAGTLALSAAAPYSTRRRPEIPEPENTALERGRERPYR